MLSANYRENSAFIQLLKNNNQIGADIRCGDSDKSFARGAVGGFSGGLGTMPQFFLYFI